MQAIPEHTGADMYVIRARHGNLIEAEFSGRLTTAETLRAVSQAFTLAEADGITRAMCDTRGVERGPGNLLLVAAAFAARNRIEVRVALGSRPEQFALGQRFARYTGARTGVGVFTTRETATAWLNSGEAPARPSSTELRHRTERARQWSRADAGPVEEQGRRSGAA